MKKKKIYLALTLAIILIFSVFFRFYHLNSKMRFVWDESRDMSAIYEIVAHKNITLFGPFNEVNGKKDFFGVFHYYLMAPALWLANYDPIGPAAFTALLGVFSVLLTYVLVKLWSSAEIALISTLIYAISPLVIKYVQWPWNPNTTPFFALFYFICLSFIIKNKFRTLALSCISGFLLGLLFQLHYFTFPLAVSYLIVLFSIRSTKQKTAINLISFITFFVIPNLSFVIFDITHNNFYWKIIYESFLQGGKESYLSFSISTLLILPLIFLNQTLSLLGFGPRLSILLCAGILFSLFLSMKTYFEANKVDLKTLIVFPLFVFLIGTAFFPKLLDLYHAAYIWWGIIFILVNESYSCFKNTKMEITYYFLLLVITSMILGRTMVEITSKPNWTQNKPHLQKLANIVISDLTTSHQTKFNIASFTDIDARAIRYRYFLLKDGFHPSGVDKYSEDDVIYIFSPHGELKTKENPAWEISTVRELPWKLIGQDLSVNVFKVEKH